MAIGSSNQHLMEISVYSESGDLLYRISDVKYMTQESDCFSLIKAEETIELKLSPALTLEAMTYNPPRSLIIKTS